MSALSTCSYYGLEKIEKQSTGFFFQDKFQSLFAAHFRQVSQKITNF